MADTINDLLQLNFASMNKPDLLKHGKAIQDALREIHDRSRNAETNVAGMENILLRLQMLENKQTSAASDIEKLQRENRSLKARVKELENEADSAAEQTEERLVDLETAVTTLDQYIRRENFEISGISSDVSEEDLETKVLQIVNSVTERREDKLIVPKDIHACHRLKKESHEQHPRVIVRMVNRKDTWDILTNKKKLADKSEELNSDSLYINENLCNNNKEMLEVARRMKKKGKVSSCWTFNGVVHIKLKQTDRYGKKILHVSQFEEYFSPKELGWE